MEARAHTATGNPWGESASVAGSMRRWVPSALIAILALVTLLVACRRVAGALTEPLGAAVLLSCVAMAAALLVTERQLAGRPGATWQSLDRGRLAWELFATSCLLVWTGSLCLPGTSSLAVLLAWLLVAAVEAWSWTDWDWLRDRWEARRPAAVVQTGEAVEAESPSELRSSTSAELLPIAIADEEPAVPDDLLRQVSYHRLANGQVAISGFARVELATEQRQASEHIPFCPPLAGTPSLEVEQLEGPNARVKVADVLPHGARLEIRLQDVPREPVEVLVEFHALGYPAPRE